MRALLIVSALALTGCSGCTSNPPPNPGPMPPPVVGYNCAAKPELSGVGVVPVARAIAGKYIIILRSSVPADRARTRETMSAQGVGVSEVQTLNAGYAARLSVTAVERILQDENVAYIQQDGMVSINNAPALGRDSLLGALPVSVVKPSVVQGLGADYSASLPVADATQALAITERSGRKGVALSAMAVTGLVMPSVLGGREQFQMVGVDAGSLTADVVYVTAGMQGSLVDGIGVAMRYPLLAVEPERSVATSVFAAPPQPTARRVDRVRGSEIHTDTIPYNLDRVDQAHLPLDGIYSPGGDGADVNVAVIDTGISNVGDFGERLQEDCFSAHGGCEDGHGHGTHVSGTVAGKRWGIAKQALLWAVRVLDASGSGSDSDVIRGVEWVVRKKAEFGGDWIINMSLGGGASPALDDAVCEAIAADVVVVVAAGNEAEDARNSSPARVRQAITVGASDRQDFPASFSNFGPPLDLYAPGVDITSDQPGGGTATWSGTSMASPAVAGAAALYLERHPGAKPQAVADWLVEAGSVSQSMVGIPPGSPQSLLYVKE